MFLPLTPVSVLVPPGGPPRLVPPIAVAPTSTLVPLRPFASIPTLPITGVLPPAPPPVLPVIQSKPIKWGKRQLPGYLTGSKIPTCADLLRTTPFGKPSLKHVFLVQKSLCHVVLPVFKAGFLSLLDCRMLFWHFRARGFCMMRGNDFWFAQQRESIIIIRNLV